ncbi:hypothetical protein YC2023_060704 [Brassica napus]|uniref:Uncharacterized protein n=1 Tax=Brassica oleracea var. oleracea TaxID=109376 RepID=A0A0D3CGZ0_BRAOL
MTKTEKKRSKYINYRQVKTLNCNIEHKGEQEQGKNQTLAKNRAKTKTLVFLRLGKGLNDRTDVTADLTVRRGSEE